MEQVTIKVDSEGNATIGVTGHAGPGCQDLTKALEDAMGTVRSDDRTPEYNQLAAESGAFASH